MTLEDLIKQYVTPLLHNKGNWYATRCMVCDDHHPSGTNFKGYRGNFNLSLNEIGYHCYNCEHSGKYDSTARSYSKNL